LQNAIRQSIIPFEEKVRSKADRAYDFGSIQSEAICDPGGSIAMTTFRIASRRTTSLLIAAILALVALAPHAVFAQAATVRLVIDYGDGTTKSIADLPWTKGATVLDAMNAARNRPHGITFEYRGSGATALLSKIDDLVSQGGGSGRKNWQLWVNTAYADRGFGVYELQAQDVVTWRYSTPDSGK
jgi:hypothetical protein